MGHYVKHIACTLCGSSDGRAVYADGSSFCFVCRKPMGGTISPYLLEQKKKGTSSLPDDCSTEYPEHVLNWIFKYDITVPELIKNNVVYSPYYDQLIFTWDNTTNPFLWQGRNFRPNAKSKCYTQGEPEQCIPLYSPRQMDDMATPLVLVEDPISALKISRLSPCSPILGSSLSPNKLKRLSALPEASMGIIIWLDGNMFHKAQQMAQRLELLGCEARAIYTELDPKAHSMDFIKDVLDAY